MRGCAGFAAGVLLAVLSWTGAAAAGECQGRIGPGTSLTGRTAYDPFSPADLADGFRISASNTGVAACTYALAFRSRTPRALLGGTLAYDLTAPGGGSLLTAGPGAGAALARLSTPLAPSTSGAVDVQLVIPRGQFAGPGTYRDTAEVELYALDAGGRIAGNVLDSTTLAILYSVERVLSVNLRGGETSTTLAFGALASGQQRTVTIEARSNQSYQLDVSSENRGALALTPKVPGQSWSVPYALAIAGQTVNLSGAASLRNLPATRPESDASFPLTVTIGEFGQKRAGRYEDVITVEIRGTVP